jgi:hypothetical protein
MKSEHPVHLAKDNFSLKGIAVLLSCQLGRNPSYEQIVKKKQQHL